MTAAHTPGPWSVGGKYTHKTVLLNAKGESIASGGNNRSVVGEELEASLILASAAPDLLQASALALDWMRQHGALLRDMAPLEAAIAKAVQS